MEYEACLSIHAVYPPAAWTTPKIVLVRTKSQGYTGAHPFAGSRDSLFRSSEAIPPSVGAAFGAPPFNAVSSISTPWSLSVVVPVGGAKGLHVPGAKPVPVVIAGPSSERSYATS